MDNASYLHMLEGRLRVNVPEVKRSRTMAARVEETLKKLDGVTHVRANPTTGNVLVLFDSQQLTHGNIIDALKRVDCLKPQSLLARQGLVTGMGDRMSELLLRSAAELAFERMVVALL